MARHVRTPTCPHDVPDGPGGPGTSRHFRDLAVRRDAAWRNPPHNGEHAQGKGIVSRSDCAHRLRKSARRATFSTQRTASVSGWPSAFSSETPTIDASVGAMSAGDAAFLYCPGL